MVTSKLQIINRLIKGSYGNPSYQPVVGWIAGLFQKVNGIKDKVG